MSVKGTERISKREREQVWRKERQEGKEEKKKRKIRRASLLWRD
jgi:hypothetical protein